MKRDYFSVLKSYAKFLRSQTNVQPVFLPSEVSSEKFHVELSLLSHPTIVGNGRVKFRVRATAVAEIPPSEKAINDCLEKSIALGIFFDEAQGFPIDEEKRIYGIAYHQALRDDDEAFADLVEPRSYSFRETWLCELEFNLADFE